MSRINSFDAKDVLTVGADRFVYYSLPRAEACGLKGVRRLPYCMQVLLENALRHEDGETVRKDTITAFSRWLAAGTHPVEIGFFPARIMMHDVSGIPLLADLAAMREHMTAVGGNGALLNPVRPVDFIMDHSVTAQYAGRPDALERNMTAEYAQNAERYRVAKWAQNAFRNIRVLPPGKGICHQINLESLSRVVWSEDGDGGERTAFPDSLLAGDSHTPMINALSVLGWGVGAIEAMSAMLGEPVSMLMPDVVGVRLVGKLREGATTTDLVLAITRRLREHGVVQRFVEYHGPGLDHLGLPERATIANMCPEYGASVGFFPTDAETCRYLELTGRGELVPLVREYCTAQGMWRDDTVERVYTDVVEFDIGSVEACVAGPKLPQSQVPLSQAHLSAEAALERGAGAESDVADGARSGLHDGDIVIAAITSCTNTSNPSVMVAAGLLAEKARARGLTAKPWVKASLSPGSRVVADYLRRAGLLRPLEELGFHITGYGCMTCCGGSGPLPDEIARDVRENDRKFAAVLSGNRNFEGRIHPLVKLAYLGSPPLVVAYALLGSMLRDITTEALGNDREGAPVYLRDIWPGTPEIEDAIRRHVTRDLFSACYVDLTSGTSHWDAIEAGDSDSFAWQEDSTYILKPPFLGTAIRHEPMTDIEGAAIIALLGDNITTDHISPGSRITEGSLAGDYLASRGVEPPDFSGYLQRRVNHEVMLRGTFNNPHLRNEMTPDHRGGWTIHQPSGKVMSIFEAHERYASEARPLVVVAGREYGTGSSRDWAAKGAHLLGVKAILAESYERIHRSNLVGMGVLPLQFEDGQSRTSLALDGSETVDIMGLDGGIGVKERVTVRFAHPDGRCIEVPVICRLDTLREIGWYQAGGVMPFVLDRLAAAA